MRVLFIILLIGASNVTAQKDVDISFDLASNSTQSGDVQVDVLKFYISSISFRFDDDSIYSESNSYHLINKEDSSSQFITVHSVPNKTISEIMFTLGTDSIANVSGALDGDLDPILGMYWAWNSGYINLKLEGSKGGQAFEFHIGGYNGIQATARTFSYAVSNDRSITIQVNPNSFIDQIDLNVNHSVMIPGPIAVSLTEFYQYMLSIE